MTEREPEAVLKAFLAAGRPPVRDYLFETAVAERIARRRAWGTVTALAPWVVAAMAVLWALQPWPEALAVEAGGVLTAAGAVVGVAVAALLAARLTMRAVRAV